MNQLSTNNLKNTYISLKGIADVKQELDFLKDTKRSQIAETIHQARGYGDLTENSEYDAAMDEQAMVENRIAELENILKIAKVIPEPSTQDFVTIGSVVRVEMIDGVDEFTITGRVETDPAKKRISNESPLGSALVGARKGDKVEVVTPSIKYQCRVLDIK
ncbi:transcription elongation factor GreA [Patescibacteria group bacterium]|nr:transcription elongation factor GreA [Patescibacteria group bacterium]